MGLTYSKSIKFGPLRFNLSGSGIGVSAGVPGLRIGTGPRGAYISGGVGGFRYRKSLGKAVAGPSARNGGQPTVLPYGHANALPQAPANAFPRIGPGVPLGSPSGAGPTALPQPGLANPSSPVPTHRGGISPARAPRFANTYGTVVHGSKRVMELGDSSGDALLHSIREQRNKLLVWPFVLALSAATLGSLVAAGVSQAAILTSITVVLAAVTGLVAWRDKLRRLTVLFYEPDAQTERLYAEVVASLREPAGAHKLQSVANTSRYANTRYSAGAQHALEFEDASITLGQAPGIVANITVPLVQAGRTLFAFYPDRVLLLQGPELGSIKYSDLIAQSSTSRYVETQNLPGDATVVDKTWTYVNNNGSPDRRFKGNRQIPVCAYSRLSLTTADGLDIRLMTSKSSAFDAFARGLQALRWAK